MRFLLVLPLVGCASNIEISIAPPDRPLGIGLTHRYYVAEKVCDGGLFPECDEGEPSTLAVSASGDAVVVSSIAAPTFALTGAALGHPEVRVESDDGATTSFELDTMAVAATQVFVPRVRLDGYRYPTPASPAAAFVGELIGLDQASTALDGSTLAGHAPLDLTAGATDARWGDADHAVLNTGFITGPVQITAAQGALELHIVDATAIATVLINDEPDDQLDLVVSSQAIDLDLFPYDAMGRPIFGAGPEPTVTIGDPNLLLLYPLEASSNMRRLTVLARDVGTTTLDIDWGGLHATFTVSITSFGV